MTESEWLAGADPRRMLEFLRDKVSQRKLRLFACGCCRVMDRRGNVSGLAVVDMAEQTAEGHISLDEAVYQASSVQPLIWDYRALAGGVYELTHWFGARALSWRHVPRVQLVRCVVGNPFRPVALNPSWRTSTVRALATAAYEERILPIGTLDTDRLAVLADALEDAGCDNADILSHCRGPGPHVRGCWVLDLILGKQ